MQKSVKALTTALANSFVVYVNYEELKFQLPAK